MCRCVSCLADAAGGGKDVGVVLQCIGSYQYICGPKKSDDCNLHGESVCCASEEGAGNGDED